jgi:5,10-methylenetetrahydrofolate reductase
LGLGFLIPIVAGIVPISNALNNRKLAKVTMNLGNNESENIQKLNPSKKANKSKHKIKEE